jgi:hypothetical protein
VTKEYQPRRGGSYRRDKEGTTVLVSRTETRPAQSAAAKAAPAAKTAPAPASRKE